MKKIIAILFAVVCASCQSYKGTITTSYDEFAQVTQTRVFLGQIDTEEFGGYNQRLYGQLVKCKYNDNSITYAFEFNIYDDNATTQIIKDDCLFTMNLKKEKLEFKPLNVHREYYGARCRLESFAIGFFTDQNIRDMLEEKEVKFKIYASAYNVIGILKKSHFVEMRKILSQKKAKKGIALDI